MQAMAGSSSQAKPSNAQAGQESGSQSKPVKPLNFANSDKKFGSGNQSDELTSYYIASVCSEGERYLYTEAVSSLAGSNVDYVSPNGGMGEKIAKAQNNCGNALRSGTDIQKENCRPKMNGDCSKKMDALCKEAGLYDTMTANPVGSAPYPPQCDPSVTGYETGCLTWLMSKVSYGGLFFNGKGFNELPKTIAEAQGVASTSADTSTPPATTTETTTPAANTLRYLSTTQTVVSTDPTNNDPKVATFKTNAAVSDSDVTVDSATSLKTPSASAYITSVNTSAGKLSSGWIRVGYALLALILAALF
jgi:hypothetical protein